MIPPIGEQRIGPVPSESEGGDSVDVSSQMIRSIEEFIPEGAESGASLVLRYGGRLLFAVAGTKFDCPPGELFYMGIGGHRNCGEDLPSCARREALEELGVAVKLTDSQESWLVSAHRVESRLELSDSLRPMSLYMMTRDDEANTYYIAMYEASLSTTSFNLAVEEVAAVIALKPEQVVNGLSHRPTLRELIREGARIFASAQALNDDVRLYPIGSAVALASVLRYTEAEEDLGS